MVREATRAAVALEAADIADELIKAARTGGRPSSAKGGAGGLGHLVEARRGGASRKPVKSSV